jgi:uncharacterized protein (DUF2132 family)
MALTKRDLGIRISEETGLIRCFQFTPSVKASLTFPDKTPWACEKVEAWFMPGKGHC